MSRQELHDLLVALERERNQFDVVEQEKTQRLDAIIESLEQQRVAPDDFDQYSNLYAKLDDAILEYESQHPALTNILSSIARLLSNFKA